MMTTLRDVEVALRAALNEHGQSVLFSARALAAMEAALAALAADREAARRARPVVERELATWARERPTGDYPTARLDFVGLFDTLCVCGASPWNILAAYDRYCDNAPPPDGEPPEVADLVRALARMAVAEMERQA